MFKCFFLIELFGVDNGVGIGFLFLVVVKVVIGW